MVGAAAAKSFDLSVAAVHGPAFWGWQPEQRPHEALGYRAAYGVLAFAGLVETLLLNAATSARVGLYIAFAMSIGAWTAIGQVELLPIHPSLRLAVRVVAGVSILSTFGALSGDQFVLRIWPLSIALGIELYITLTSIGLSRTGISIYRSVVISLTHVAVVVALALVTGWSSIAINVETALQIYLGIHIQLAITLLAFEVARLLANAANDEVKAAALSGRASGLGARTGWLHDTAISELKGLRNSSNKDDAEHLISSIARIEDELRDEYLELQMAEADEVDLGAVMYRYARKFRSADRVVELPGFEVSQIVVDGATARQFKGFLDVAVQNAVDAGATWIAITAQPGVADFAVAVEDDAGGFDHTLARAGGSMTRLMRDAKHAVEISSVDSGTRLSTLITRQRNP